MTDRGFAAELWCLVLVHKACGCNQLLAAVTTQRSYRQTCRITIPRAGALALRLRSSDPNNVHNHTQHNGREHAEGQGKTQFKTYISKIQDKRREVHETRATRNAERTQRLGLTIHCQSPSPQKRKAGELYSREARTAPWADRCREVTGFTARGAVTHVSSRAGQVSSDQLCRRKH